MNLNFYESHHFFENRLYISSGSPTEIEAKIKNENGEELKGFGLRSYSAFAGTLLSAIGLATKLTIDNQTFYVNNKSFSQFIIRASELGEERSNVPKSMDQSYRDHKASGYKRNVVEAVNAQFQEIIRPFKDRDQTLTSEEMSQILQTLVRQAKYVNQEGGDGA